MSKSRQFDDFKKPLGKLTVDMEEHRTLTQPSTIKTQPS
jgi:hypothetical protein